MLIDKREFVEVPTLLYNYSREVKSEKAERFDSLIKNYPDGVTDEGKEKIEEVVYQLYMNDIFVGDKRRSIAFLQRFRENNNRL